MTCKEVMGDPKSFSNEPSKVTQSQALKAEFLST